MEGTNLAHIIITDILSIGLIIVLLPLFYCIIWYERYGTDNKRTMVNKLVSLMCWNIISWNLTAQIIGIANFPHTPLNNHMKLINIVTRQTITLRQLMLLNAVTLTRYIFICWLKNPIAFFRKIVLATLSTIFKLNNQTQAHPSANIFIHPSHA